MNYVRVVAGVNSNVSEDDSFLVSGNNGLKPSLDDIKQDDTKQDDAKKDDVKHDDAKLSDDNTGSEYINTASPLVNTVGSFSVEPNDLYIDAAIRSADLPHDLNMPNLEDIVQIDDDDGLFGDELDMTNISNSYSVLTTPLTRIHKDHSLNNMIGDVQSGILTRSMLKPDKAHGFI
ncbi:hypothetical protein Tco_0244965, partial [Tanacetum coccineum]